jgi:flagellar motor switch protein FliM
MSRFLSQEEIDALLSAHVSPGTGGDRRPVGEATKVATYNFRRPDRVSKEQLRSLHFLHDRFAVNVSTSLSAFLRAVTEVSIVSVEQFAYSEFLMSLPDPTAFYAVHLSPVDMLGALEVNPVVSFAMLDRMLGGSGSTPSPNRALTEIELNVLDSVIRIMLGQLAETWHGITDVQFRIHGRDTRPQMLQITASTEIVILLGFDVRIADARGMLSVCIPAAAIETMEEKVAQGLQQTRRQPTPREEAHLHANLGRVPLPVTATIETRVATREFLALRPGDVLALGHSVGRPLDVRVGQVTHYGGRLTTHGSAAGVVIEPRRDGVIAGAAA